MEFLARVGSGSEGKVIRLGEIPAAKSVEELFRRATSRSLRLVARLFMLALTFLVWLLVLIWTAAVLLVHLMVAPIARGTFATLSAALDAEASANGDMTAAFDRVRGRAASAEVACAGPQEPPSIDSARRLPTGDQRGDAA
jgi:hypothetical protein